MGQSVISVRVDEDIKRDVESLYNELGLNISTAVNMFFRQSLRERAIPFPIKAKDDYYNEANMKRLLESIEQAKAGKVVVKTMAELESMEND